MLTEPCRVLGKKTRLPKVVVCRNMQMLTRLSPCFTLHVPLFPNARSGRCQVVRFFCSTVWPNPGNFQPEQYLRGNSSTNGALPDRVGVTKHLQEQFKNPRVSSLPLAHADTPPNRYASAYSGGHQSDKVKTARGHHATDRGTER